MSIVAWLKGLTRRRLDDEDFRHEIRAHLAIATEEKMADGADRQTAHYAALNEFGNVTLTTPWASASGWPTTTLSTSSGPTSGWRTVIGVAADVKYLRINESPRPYLYLPFLQAYRSSMILHTQGPAPVDVLVDQARAYVGALADLPILSARPLAEGIAGALISST